MAYYHYQCEHCLQTTYMYDDGEDDGIVVQDAFDDCGCQDDYEDDYEEDDDDD